MGTDAVIVLTSRLPEASLGGRFWQAASACAADPGRLSRYRDWRDRYRSLGTDRLARLAIGKCLRLPPEGVRLGRDPYNRPFLRVPAGFAGDFNASHHRDLVGCAVVPRGRVGFDIADPEDFHDPLLVAALSGDERERLRDIPGDGDRRRFMARLWALKEAYLKLAGTGLGIEPSTIAFDMARFESFGLVDSRQRLATGGKERERVRFFLWSQAGMVVAAATTTPDVPLVREQVTWTELFSPFIPTASAAGR
jgi:phosphopantetheinyl transferase